MLSKSTRCVVCRQTRKTEFFGRSAEAERYQLIVYLVSEKKLNIYTKFIRISRCSAVGSALGSGPRGHGFESRHFDQYDDLLLSHIKNGDKDSLLFFMFPYASSSFVFVTG